MTDKQSQTSSQSSPGTDVEMKPDHSTLDTTSGSESSDLLDTSSSSPPQVAKGSQAVNSASSSCIRSNGSTSSVQLSGDKMIITVAPFTGGPFSVTVNKTDSVEDLKKVVSKKLKVLKERICLLYRESQLSEGTLEDNHLVNGSRITLLPRAETGLLAQRPEQSVMQALESLNDNQVVDFLSGKAPLNLTMRLGDHMMLIQLQLSTVNSAAASGASKRARTSTTASKSSSTRPEAPSAPRTTSATTTTSDRSSPTPSTSSSTFSTPTSSPPATPPMHEESNYRPKLDTRALTEASKNLTQTLKQLSSEVLTTRTDEERPRKRPRPSSASGATSSSGNGASGGGAIIESMHHHGKGVYSGTFSGTLNPALQDRNGQPKRDITTIIHILNDLLCAQYKNYAAAPNATATGASAQPRKATSASAAASAATSGSKSSTCPTPPPSAGSFSKTSAFSVNGIPTMATSLSDQAIHDRVFKAGFEPTNSFTYGPITPGDEQTVTRSKMEQLRRIMEERKARRRLRKEQAAARAAQYSTSWSVKSSEARASPAPSNPESTAKNSGSNSSANSGSNSSASTSNTSSDIFNPELEPVTA